MTESTFLLAVLLWVVCGGVAAFLAQAKGRSPSNWFLCGFFFGPFGAIAAAMARTGEQVSQIPAQVGSYRDENAPPKRGELWLGWSAVALGVVLAAGYLALHHHLNTGALIAMLVITLVTAGVMLAIDPVRNQIRKAEAKRAQAPLPPRNAAQ